MPSTITTSKENGDDTQNKDIDITTLFISVTEDLKRRMNLGSLMTA